MRTLILSALFATSAGLAAAQPLNENPPTWTIQCIEVGGQAIAPVCKTPASRLDLTEDICLCPAGGTQVKVAICAKGQTPPPEGKALDIARQQNFRDGSLIGDTVDGRPICVAPRRR